MMQPEIIRLSGPKRNPKPEPAAPPPPPRLTLLESLNALELLKRPAAKSAVTENAHRVLKALTRGAALASALARELDLDQAHLSRIVKQLATGASSTAKPQATAAKLRCRSPKRAAPCSGAPKRNGRKTRANC